MSACRIVKLKRQKFPWLCVGCHRVFKFESRATKHAPVQRQRMPQHLAAAVQEMDRHFQSI